MGGSLLRFSFLAALAFLTRETTTSPEGNASRANASRGDAVTETTAHRLAQAFRGIKVDDVAPRLQKEFFDRMVKLAPPKS